MVEKIIITQTKTLEKRYLELKNEMSKLVHIESEVWKKYLILSEANKIAIKLFGKKHTIRKLAHDFDMSSTNVYEILSLDKMTHISKKLLKAHKISASKLAMICSTKNVRFQDEIVKLVVEKNLTVNDIHNIKPQTQENVNELRFQTAIKKGFASKERLTRSFLSYILRINELLKLNSTEYSSTKLNNIKHQLLDLKKNIDFFLEKLK